MNALDVLRVLRRHPFVLVLLLILTVGGAGLVYIKLPVSYQSTASEILLPSEYANPSGKNKISNPYAHTGDTPSQIAASQLVVTANGGGFRRSLAAKGVVSDLTVVIDPAAGGVLIDVTATDRVPAATSRDLQTVLTALSATLRAKQAAFVNLSPQLFFALQPVNPPDRPVQATTGRFKTSVISGALGLIVTVIIILIFDAQVRRHPRGRRRTDGGGRARRAPEPDAPADGRAAGTRRSSRRRDDDVRTDRRPAVTVPDRDGPPNR